VYSETTCCQLHRIQELGAAAAAAAATVDGDDDDDYDSDYQ